ncbi:MAG: DUF3822 family protein [Bacteroidota bacterium]
MNTTLENAKALAGIQAEKIDTSRLGHYDLHVQLGAGRLLYAVAEHRKNRCAVLEEYPLHPPRDYSDAMNQLGNILDSSEVLRLEGWRSLRPAFTVSKFSLVPEALFEESLAPEYLRLLAPAEPEDEEVLFHSHKAGFVTVYAANKRMLGFFRSSFGPDVMPLPHTALLAEGCLHLAEQNPGKAVLLLKSEAEHATICAAKDGSLLFCNIFPCTTGADTAYYALLAAKELDLNPSELLLYVCGELNQTSPAFTRLLQYFRNLAFVPRPAFIQLGKEFSDMDVVKYYDLFCMNLI